MKVKRGLAWVLTMFLGLTLLAINVFVIPTQAYSESDWVLASSAPSGAEVTARKWTYDKTTYADSRNTSMSGYTQSGFDWIESGRGSVEYATFPKGYDTGNNYYISMAKEPLSNSESATSKRVVEPSTWAGYIYWHWMYNCGGANAYYRTIYDHKGIASYNGYYYQYFGAFKSSSSYTATAGGASYSCGSYNYPTYYNTGRNSYAESQGSYYWYRFNYYVSSYVDYYKLFHYYKTEKDLPSETPIFESSSSSVVISNIKEWVRYKNKFTISYHANGGSNAPASQTKSFGVDLTLSSSQPTRGGYDFLGWSVSPNALSGSYNPGGRFTTNSDTTLYAIWKQRTVYTVTYDYKTNGGTSCPSNSASVYEGDNANLSVTPRRDGWNFVGWNTNRDATTGLGSLKVTGNTTLYAIFNKTVTARLYTGANALFSSPTKTIYNRSSGADIALPGIPDYNGWYPVCWVQKGTGSEHTSGSTVTISGNTDFYAKYVKTFALSYNANGGSTTPPTQNTALYYRADGTYEQNKPTLAGAIQRSGFSFDKWAYGSINGTKYSAGDTISVNENVTMYATWTALPALSAPSISVSDITGGKSVNIQANESGSILYYTLDGSSPSAKSSVYSKPVEFWAEGEYTIKVFAIMSGYADSPVAIQTVQVSCANQPTSNFESGYVRPDAAITLTTDTPDGNIYYTLDGTTPTAESLRYDGPFFVQGDCTLKAVAICPGYAASKCATYHYKEAPIYAVDSFGYSFVNAAASFGYTKTIASFLDYCIPYSSAKLIFGDSVKGKSAYTAMAKYPWRGNCCGMAATSALFFSTETEIRAAQFGQTTVNQLKCSDYSPGYENMLIRTFIEAMQISQYTVQFDRDYTRNRVTNTQLRAGQNLNEMVDSVQADLTKNKPDIITVWKGGDGGHALLAYHLQVVSDAESRLYVYDCNHPNDSNRFVKLQKDAAGNYIGWSYDMGGYGIWGSAGSINSFISYIPFDTIRFIWENRGRLYDNYLTLTVASENVAIHNLEGELVGEFIDGEFYSEQDNVFSIPNLSLSDENDLSVYLPEDYYVITNLDGGEFEASMVGENIGATVTTNADTVCFEMNEALRMNGISVEEAGSGINYTVSLDSSYMNTNNVAVFKNVTISGSGVGDTMRLASGASGNPVIENSMISSYKVNGVEQIKYTITASAGSGGTISPKGDIAVSAESEQTFIMKPNAGYKVKDVIVDGYSIGPEQEFTFESVGKDHGIRVIFERAFSIDAIDLNGRELSVEMKNDTPARLYAAVYTSKGKMIALAFSDIARNATMVYLNFDAEIPSGSIIKVFLLSKTDAVPLCDSKTFYPN